MKMAFIWLESPIGPLTVRANERGITAVSFGKTDEEGMPEPRHPLLLRAASELEAYFAKKRTRFDVPVSVSGTPFQMAVWKALKQIPYGETCSYQDIAEAVGNPKAVRAVGQANRKNPVPILIPCHRVIGKDKSLTGYAGSRIDQKAFLLRLEGAMI
ncbi:methylated-DNA--[protein]-cysteine S-methyltransferase [Heyndrickxia coagulans]|uniref:methylated-DNA--[protein]-cysteine S-methyltransferase n=1 Tax=Heyndrickxia coagulans TaxID=1398 RepID=UPI0028114D12|nr:methylated-DNA--[protein]-cysteine S-methyltransferase [Heyndrickxia coagulans]WMM89817.1 methylated-DNA--[protein]-cysteine S-methyltransferase [Heyndrickxia coagulans]